MFKRIFLFFITLICLFNLNIAVFSLERLNFDGFIADNANILPYGTKALLNSYLLDLQQKTKADVAVITLNSLGNSTIEQTALTIGRTYKIGDKVLNNGAVVLVVPNERQARIEIGYGLEGIITDAHAGRILDDYMIPFFKQGDYIKGTVDGVTALAFDIADGYGVQLDIKERPVPIRQDTAGSIADIIILLLVLYFLLGGFNNFKGGGIFFGGGGSSGGSSGFGGFGGGSGFGGGGSSRSW